MRIRHCVVRAIVRQPWLFEDPDELSRALTRLVVDVLVARLSIQLDRVGQVAPLGTVTIRVVLPAPVVLALGGESPTSSHGRRLSSFGAEVAVHDAASSALRAAMERVTFEPAKVRSGPDRPESPETVVTRFEQVTGGGPAEKAAGQPESDADTVSLVTPDVCRLIAAVAATLLAAERLGRLSHVMQHTDAALIAEWVRLLDSATDAVAAVPPSMRPHHWPDVATITSSLVRLDASDRHPGGAPREPQADSVADMPVSKTEGRRPTESEIDATIEAVLAALGDTVDSGAVRLEVAAIAAARLGMVVSDVRVWRALRQRLGPVISEPVTAPVAGGVPASRAPERGPTESEIDAMIGAVLAALVPTADSAAVRLEVAATAAARLGVVVSDVRVWRALQRRLGPVISEPATTPVVEAPALLTPVPSSSTGRSHGRRPATRRELEVASVLPFLLVGPLDELGVLDTVAAALVGAGWGDLLVAFAGCLARKALPPPGGGWLHAPEVAATVAAFAGQQDVPDGAATERLGQTVTRWWPVVAEVVTATLVDLRAPESPLVVTQASTGLVVADADGLAPMLWGADVSDVGRLWEDCGRPPMLAEPLLASTVLATFAPTSDEAQTAVLAELVTLADARPASGRQDLAPELDAPLSLLAGLGLSALAWELWQRHESAHPALAIHRLGDLDGRVTLEPDRVTVRMPLGRRHADLRDSGLLRTVDDVPWLHGRCLELLGG